MNKKNRIIIPSVIVSLVLLVLIFFVYNQNLFKTKWYGDKPYNDFYCAVYDISPKNKEGGITPPPIFSVKIITNAPANKTFVKFTYNTDINWYRSERIWLSDVTKLDDGSYLVTFDTGNYHSADEFTLDAHQWVVTVYYCEDPPAGEGIGIWYISSKWTYYKCPSVPVSIKPTANAGGNYFTTVGQSIRLDGSSSSAYNNYDITTYLWDVYDDGTWDLSGPKPKVVFNKEGTYKVRLRVFDTNGLYDDDIAYVNVAQTEKYYKLDVNVNPENAGYVVITPYFENMTYPEGTDVTLNATAYDGYIFSHWEGDANGSSTPITITMDSNKTVTAVFSEIQTNKYTLSVSVNNPDGGWVDVYPAGGIYDYGTVVTLTAHAKEGYRFSHWGGDASGTSETITIVMDSNKNVVAYFEKTRAYAIPDRLYLLLALGAFAIFGLTYSCLLYTSPSPRDKRQSRMPSSA